jgi:hypothetical protein
LDCRHVSKTCAFHDALQAGKQKEVHPLYFPDLVPAVARLGEYVNCTYKISGVVIWTSLLMKLRIVYLIYFFMDKFLCCWFSVHDSFHSNHTSFICASSHCKKCFLFYSNLTEYQHVCMLVMLISEWTCNGGITCIAINTVQGFVRVQNVIVVTETVSFIHT